ncbi:hypothetical protein BC937DRAFT_89304 [Endogone sp. FLAS-F59071]|nr:hypothetical protein BC937DRAFT_89304 [Endogone sp. FLAS-F59071]|eukprot:RUS17964.1 hypothetical protein BC937DRAFT_89304 [Endogone sp. FLAS-F59071]
MPSTADQNIQDVVLPGDPVPASSADAKVILGPGLTQEKDVIIAMKAGVLMHEETYNRWWVESNQRRYVSSTGESVIGIVTARIAEGFKVEIGAAHQALLPLLAFEGATKKNRPNLAVGALVYARVSLANRDMEPELECINPTTGRADGFGELKGGFMFRCSLGLCRRLLATETPILSLIGEHFPFEVTIGRNGRVWVNSTQTKTTILITNAIQNSEYLSEKECCEMVKTLVGRL